MEGIAVSLFFPVLLILALVIAYVRKPRNGSAIAVDRSEPITR